MRRIVLKRKTGFKVNDIYQPIIIRDFRGILFYSTESLLPKVKEFNLPEGTYFVDTGYFTEKLIPVRYPKIPMPFAQRFFMPDPSNFTIVFAPNPNKCTVNWVNKTITFDPVYKEYPLPKLFFILFHELGHKIYRDEDKADIYAVNAMLAHGFNLEQTAFSPSTLSNNSLERKINVVRKMLKHVV